MPETGAIFYRGPSLLTGEPIVGALTGLEGGSMNPKTGPMVQAWILRADRAPMDAVRDGSDDAICGPCALRGDGAAGRRCYVTVWLGPHNVWKAMARYHEASWADAQALVEGRAVRLGAYGDPAAIPFEVWWALLATAAGWVGYTHQWKTCDDRFRTLLMASVDTEAEFFDAGLRGWRTFRVRRPDAPLITGAEFVCPASDEAGHRTTCQRCQLCRGTSSPARSVAIMAHGKPGNLKAYGLDIRGAFGRRRSSPLVQA
jgi:hypothetical protein